MMRRERNVREAFLPIELYRVTERYIKDMGWDINFSQFHERIHDRKRDEIIRNEKLPPRTRLVAPFIKLITEETLLRRGDDFRSLNRRSSQHRLVPLLYIYLFYIASIFTYREQRYPRLLHPRRRGRSNKLIRSEESEESDARWNSCEEWTKAKLPTANSTCAHLYTFFKFFEYLIVSILQRPNSFS